MTKIVDLTPEVKISPRCATQRKSIYYNDKPSTDKQCTLKARYIINGKPLCSRHAGIAAIEILLQQEISKEIKNAMGDMRRSPYYNQDLKPPRPGDKKGD